MNYLSETRTNVIGRYAMLTFKYRLNKMGNMQGMGGRGGFGGRGGHFN